MWHILNWSCSAIKINVFLYLQLLCVCLFLNIIVDCELISYSGNLLCKLHDCALTKIFIIFGLFYQ